MGWGVGAVRRRGQPTLIELHNEIDNGLAFAGRPTAEYRLWEEELTANITVMTLMFIDLDAATAKDIGLHIEALLPNWTQLQVRRVPSSMLLAADAAFRLAGSKGLEPYTELIELRPKPESDPSAAEGAVGGFRR